MGGLRSQRLPWAWWLAKRQRERRWPVAPEAPSYSVPAPTAFWRLEEASGTRNDSVGARHLTPTGGTYGVTGRMANCAYFETTSSMGLIGTDHADLRPGNADFSISLWCAGTETAIYSGRILVSKHYFDGDTYEEGFQLGFTGYHPYFYVLTDGDDIAYLIQSGTEFYEYVWHHVVFTFSRANNRARIYVNGALSAEATNWTDPLRGSTADLWLGSDADQGLPWDGWLDGVGWFKGVELTAAHVAELAQGLEYFSGAWHLVPGDSLPGGDPD
jgi:hypothetical protein